MSIKDHADYIPESRRLAITVAKVNATIEENIEKKNIIKEDILEEFENMERADSAQSYQRIALDASLYDLSAMRYRALIKAALKPYFARIDFRREGVGEAKAFYIGKIALVGDDIENPLIVDWRAPISSVYYDGRLGEVSYDSPGGEQRGELNLKRQYTINKAELEGIMDVDITANDAFLQASLGENKDKKLQDIVSTIQAEQNNIIRADIYRPIIVQGVAGSGKTTIALHRIAYLIYTFNTDFNPANFLIIAPNRLFLNYISEVLPELGVESVRQSTFADLAYQLLDIKHKLADPDAELLKAADKSGTAGAGSFAAFKSSLRFRGIIDNYLEFLEYEFIPDRDLYVEEYTISTCDEIQRMFKALPNIPLYRRIPLMKQSLRDKVKEETATILAQVDCDYEAMIREVRDTVKPSEGRREKLSALFDERDAKLAGIKKTAKTAVTRYFKLLREKNLVTHYRELVTDPEVMLLMLPSPNMADKSFIAALCAYNTGLLRRSRVDFEDLTALLYLGRGLFGYDDISDIKYIVIDEAQDLSAFQLHTLKTVFGTDLFTLLGDLAQGIRPFNGIGSWENAMAILGGVDRCRFMTLEQSYRTTVEIMDAANGALELSGESFVKAIPVLRHGGRPRVYGTTEAEFAAVLDRLLAEKKAAGYKSIAVICKTPRGCASVMERSGEVLRLLSPDDLSYEAGTVIVPSYQAKGLEFDAVIICALTDDWQAEGSDIKLLYVAMTRALHSLDFICAEGKMELLAKVPGLDTFIPPAV